MADITGVIKGGRKSILGLSQNHASVTLGIIKDGNKYLVGSPAPAVPSGKTVTPINDVTIWQQCAGIANPTYTTLAEVLADVGILSALMASDNAVDYLVRCKAWCGLGLVPTMTSNTTPSGECFGSGVYAAVRDYFCAFDNDESTYWVADTTGSGKYIAYDFGEPVNVCKAKGYGYESRQFYIQYSDDKTTWNPTGAILTFDSSKSWKEATFSASSHRYWRAWHNSTSLAQLFSLQFYGQSICDNQYAMQYIGMFDYASDTLLADADWCEAICNSAYFESVLNAKVPTMTSNTTPSGTVSASTYLIEPYKAFDGNDSSYWVSNGGVPQYIEYDFGHDVLIAKMKYLGYATNNTLNGYEITGFDSDNIDYLLISGNMQNVGTMQSVNIFTNSAKYRKYRLKATSMYSGQQPNAKTIQFYGRERGTVQSWLKAGGITGKTYTDISEVLNDPITLATLMSNQNAVNYLVTVKKWASTICANQTAMQDIGANNYCANTLLADSDWRDAICNSTYFESVLNVKAPTMTDNTHPSGEASSTNFTSDAWKAFDGDIVTAPNAGASVGGHFNQYDFGKAVSIFCCKYYYGYASVTSIVCALETSDNGNDFITLESGVTPNNNTWGRLVGNYGAHRYWRLSESVTPAKGGSANEVQFYGREDV